MHTPAPQGLVSALEGFKSSRMLFQSTTTNDLSSERGNEMKRLTVLEIMNLVETYLPTLQEAQKNPAHQELLPNILITIRDLSKTQFECDKLSALKGIALPNLVRPSFVRGNPGEHQELPHYEGS